MVIYHCGILKCCQSETSYFFTVFSRAGLLRLSSAGLSQCITLKAYIKCKDKFQNVLKPITRLLLIKHLPIQR